MYNMPWKVDILNDERESYPCFKILLKVATNLFANFNPKKTTFFVFMLINHNCKCLQVVETVTKQ